MRKYGKFEKRPTGAKTRSAAKSALLQTYFVSLACLVLCVSMFFGTSYAWFTSEVVNEGNEIYIGTLDVGLYKQDGADLSKAENKLFDGNIRWEPGYTTLETVKVVNEGNLAFKYVLGFTDGRARDDQDQEAALAKLAGCFDVWVYSYADNADTAPALTTYQAITKEDSGWTHAGTLDQLLAGGVVLEGSIDEVADQDGEPVATEATYVIALHMQEDAPESVMKHRITLNVKLVAYQMTSEADELGNSDYDLLVGTEKDLRKAMQTGGNITLMRDVLLTDSVTVPAGKEVVLDLNGHSISQSVACTDTYSMICNRGNLTITGEGRVSLTDTGAGDPSFGWGSYTIRNEGILILENGTVEHLGQQAFATHCIQAIFQYSGSTTINGGKVSTPSYRSIRLWHGDMTINGGEMDGQVWVQTQTGESAALTISGGSFSPNGNDMSSVYVGNDKNTVSFSVTGGSFATKIGAIDPDDMAGAITGGTFTDAAKQGTPGILFAPAFGG